MSFEFKFHKKHLKNITNKELKDIKGIVLHSEPEHFNEKFVDLHKLISTKNKEEEDFGYHYLVDDGTEVGTNADVIFELVPKEYMTKNISGKSTYINKSLFKENPQENLIAIYISVRQEDDYEKEEKKLIKFIVTLLREHNLTVKDVWRGFDLSKDSYGPFHMLDKKIFEKFIAEIEKFVPYKAHNGGETEGIPEEEAPKPEPEEPPIEDDKIEIISPFKEDADKHKITVTEYVCKVFRDNKSEASIYASKHQPWDKDRDDTKNKESLAGDLESRDTPYKNLLQFTISENPPVGLDHCEKAVDELSAVETSQETMVEPIYPDIIAPPGDMVHISDGFSETKVQSRDNVPLTPEELEKRQKTFDFSKFENMKKETKGRPVNVEDPFPVDDQIKKLEEHFPKVKVDKVTFNLKDTNHPNSEIGNALAKNAAMSYDMVTEIAKRTEQRLVKLENNLATVMRNLFRVSSRMNINCVYYGGQSVYGKYKCIRCLHDDRINDGAVLTLDQCLSCTRYEPVLGQVYAILDETGSNIVQVMDDLQMSYMDLQDYKNLNSVEGYHEPKYNAQVNKHPADVPKPFIENKWKDTEEETKEKEESNKKPDKDKEDKPETDAETDDKANVPTEEEKEVKIVNGFKMNWNPVKLETQRPSINTYVVENLKAEKTAVKSDTQGIDRDIYVDSRQDAVEYERLEFDIKDYEFPGFGVKTAGPGGGGPGALVIRQKIVDYALAAVKLCDEGKAGYWLDGTHRNCHGSQTCGSHSDGKQYWDCSSLVRDGYKEAGLGIMGQLTYDLFDNCKQSAGGLLIPLSEQDKALPGDMVFFDDGVADDLPTESLNGHSNSGIRHVAIYIGNGNIAHAVSEKWGIKQTEVNWDKGSFCFGRPKALIDLDNAASVGNASEQWTREYHQIPDELWNASAVGESNARGFIDNIKQYGYRDALVKVAQAKKLDPYFVAAICSIESSGNPTLGGPHPGIMQCTGGYGTSSLSGIEDNFNIGCDALLGRYKQLTNCGWVAGNNMHIVASSHNTGQYGVTDAHGCSNETTSAKYPKLDLATVKIPASSEALRKYTDDVWPTWSPEVKRTYATKVLRAYNVLYAQNILNLPRENNSGGGTTPEGMPPIQKKQIQYNTSNRTQAIKYIAIHDTANNGGTAQNHFDYFNGGNRNASADYFVDNVSIIEISDPTKYACWHVGDGEGRNGITNQNAIGIEMCLENDGSVSPNTFNNTINLVKHLMKTHNISKSNVVRHYDASGKNCPNKLMPNNWAKWNELKSKL